MQLTKTDLWALRDALYLAQINRQHRAEDPIRIKALNSAQEDLFRLLEQEIENSSSDDAWTLEQN